MSVNVEGREHKCRAESSNVKSIKTVITQKKKIPVKGNK